MTTFEEIDESNYVECAHRQPLFALLLPMLLLLLLGVPRRVWVYPDASAAAPLAGTRPRRADCGTLPCSSRRWWSSCRTRNSRPT